MKDKTTLALQLQNAASNMKKARIVAEQIRLASEPEPQLSTGTPAPVGPAPAPSFPQGKR